MYITACKPFINLQKPEKVFLRAPSPYIHIYTTVMQIY